MGKITLEQIENLEYIGGEIETNYGIEFDCGNFKFGIKENITKSEECLIIDIVAENSFIGMNYSPTLRECLMEIMFAKIFIENGVDIPDDIEDTYAIYEIICKLNIVSNVKNLCGDVYARINRNIDEKIEFHKRKICAVLSQNSTEVETLENINDFIISVTNLTDKFTTILESGGNKILKQITPKKINGFIDEFKNESLKIVRENLKEKNNKVISMK
ncbi:hypothetical protein [Anaerovorax sp. IOR16]|uniref:hypothetical protein n=1 Tax=Anaerovorax sp. IOR16 TaxID=2773458 RepID=UPI0019D22D5D|nr:hypothetical protein [Anaerovorax sp. IOR16]